MPERPRVALFIDAENARAEHLPDYLAHCRHLGKPTIARCYGGTTGLKTWEKAIAEHHLLPMLTPPAASKENASDFALTIDAVALLHRGLFDHAVIASSDADFTQLAMHIREHGKGIDGIGEPKTMRALRKAFDNFIELPSAETAAKLAAPATTSNKLAASPPAAPNNYRKELLATFHELSKLGRVTLPTFGKTFKQQHPNIQLGKGKLKKTLQTIGLIVNGKQEVTAP